MNSEKNIEIRDIDFNKLLNTREAAELLNISQSTLASDVSRQILRVPYVKIGKGLRRYRYGDLVDYVKERTFNKGPP